MKASRGKERRSFSKIEREWDIQIPNLLDVQLDSFRNFLQADIDPLKRKLEGRGTNGEVTFSVTFTYVPRAY